MIPEIANLPEISFIENKTLDDVQARMVADYEERYRELTGKELRLRRADPEMLKLYACSVQIYQMLLHIDFSGKQDLIKYSWGAFLDNLAANKGITRLPASPAVTTVRFTLSEERPDAVSIPKGIRVTSPELIYFATDDYAEVPPGEMYVDVTCTATETGAYGNGIIAGDINILVDTLPYVASVENTELTYGGSDIEDDESLAERVYLAPSGYSVAGSTGAYIYHTKSFNSAVGDVNVYSPTPGDVEVRFLLKDGALPTETLCDELYEYLNADTIRPLTDRLKVSAPEELNFNIELSYYINKTDTDKAVSIQNAVNKAIEDYIVWQTHTIGRDINPSELIKRVVAAGAKRVEITEPEFTKVPATKVARVEEQKVTYGGLEDD